MKGGQLTETPGITNGCQGKEAEDDIGTSQGTILVNAPCIEQVEQHFADLEAAFSGHRAVLKQLGRVHDHQLRPYCNLLYARIKTTILPLFEDAFVAVEILSQLEGNVPLSLLESLHHRIKLALDYPPYTGGGLGEG